MNRLDDEIEAFVEYMSPSAAEEEKRTRTIQRYQKLITGFFANRKVCIDIYFLKRTSFSLTLFLFCPILLQILTIYFTCLAKIKSESSNFWKFSYWPLITYQVSFFFIYFHLQRNCFKSILLRIYFTPDNPICDCHHILAKVVVAPSGVGLSNI